MIIHVNVKPGAKEERVEKVSEGEFEISVKERAEDNEANKRVVNILSKKFGVDFRKIRIKNPKSRKKIVEIG